MVGRSRASGFERALAPGAFACLALGVGACLAGSGPPEPPGAVEAGGSSLAGSVNAAGAGATGPSAGGSPQIIPSQPGCVAPPVVGTAVFAAQSLDSASVARRILFSWTTDEQAAELRRDQVLFTRSERPGLGPGYAFNIVQQLAQDQTLPERAQLASLLGGELFAKARYAWSEPWATRMGWPGEDYCGNLLRIVLKPEAWVAKVMNGDLSVVDLQNQPVSLTAALANPERVGAIFYEKDAFAGGPSCNGSFISGSNGYREFVVGNLAMVEEWSIGTQQIHDRLSANIEQLTSFLERIRGCPVTNGARQWNLTVVCQWNSSGAQPTELSTYQQALAIPSDNYLAVPERIAAMIETLQGDLFELDPLVVNPGSP